MKAYFTDFSNESNWVEGKIGKYSFSAKLFNVGSEYGINDGRVSKLSIYDDKVRQKQSNFFASCLVNYDRGWDIEPREEHMEIFKLVMELLENSPERDLD